VVLFLLHAATGWPGALVPDPCRSGAAVRDYL